MASPTAYDKEMKDAQLRKLQLEIISMESNHRWTNKFPQYIPILTALVAVAGFLWGIYTYNHQENARQAAVEQQTIKDREVREKEFKKRFWEEQLEAYSKIIQSAARLATLPAGGEREKEFQNFREVYHGNLIMFTDKQVLEVVKEFLQKYLNYQDDRALQGDVDKLSRKLAIACRESLRQTWDVPLEKIEFSQIP